MATWSVEAQGLESPRWESSDSGYWFCEMTYSAGCWWRACHCVRGRTGTDTDIYIYIYICIYIYIYTHTHKRTHLHTPKGLEHVIPCTRYNYSGLSFPFVCPFLYFCPYFLYLSSHLLFRKTILFFVLFFLLFSFVSSSDLFRTSFQIPHFFFPFCSILPCFHSFFFSSLSFVAHSIICLYFFCTHSLLFLFWTRLYVVSLLQFNRKFKFAPKFQTLNLLWVQSCYF